MSKTGLALLLVAVLPALGALLLSGAWPGLVQSSSPSDKLADGIVTVTRTVTITVTDTEVRPLPVDTLEQKIIKVYEKVKNSVVLVTALSKQTVLTIYGPVTEWSRSEGSGFFVEYDGKIYVVTNYHVVSGADRVSITLLNGTALSVYIVGVDPYSDLAVLGFNGTYDFEPLEVRSSKTLRIGETVIAVGNPFGLAGTLTIGVVSQLGRSITSPTVTGFPIANLIQTSAPINPGNSGGPLLDVDGRVVGITTAIIAGAQGVGFAVPSDTLIKELPYLVEEGSYNLHPWIGVSGIDLDYFTANELGLPVTYGFLIVEVVPGGPAEKAGLKGAETQAVVFDKVVPIGGDVIIGIDNVVVTGIDDILSYLEENVKPGDTVTLRIVRDGEIKEVDVVVEARPPPGISQ